MNTKAAYTEIAEDAEFWAAIDEMDAQREAEITAEAEREALMDADLDELISELDAQPEPYSDEWEPAPAASLWTATTGPDALWNSRPLTEWEIA